MHYKILARWCVYFSANALKAFAVVICINKSNYWNTKPNFGGNLILPRHGAEKMGKVPQWEDVEVYCGLVSPLANCSFPQKNLYRQDRIQILCHMQIIVI